MSGAYAIRQPDGTWKAVTKEEYEKQEQAEKPKDETDEEKYERAMRGIA